METLEETRAPARRKTNEHQGGPSLCTGHMRHLPYMWDHRFVASGKVKWFGCGYFGSCRTEGRHQACSVCGFPSDEHPAL